MHIDALTKKLRAAQMARNLILVGFAASLGVNVLLSIRLSAENTQVVLVPTRVGDGIIARGGIDVRHMEAIALDAVYAMYNISPNTVRYGRDVIERVSAVQQRARLLDQYDDVADDIRQRRISTVFRPVKLTHDLGRLQVHVEGMLATYLNTVEVSEVPRVITLSFTEEAASVRLSQMQIKAPEE